MHAETQPRTQRVTAPRTVALTRLVETYDGELEARRTDLARNRDVYRARLATLADLDPNDCSGLSRLYREHVRQIECLLLAFAENTANRRPH